VVVLSLLIVPLRPLAEPPLDAPEIFARAKAAQGGSAWDTVHTLRLTGVLSTGGLTGSVTSLADVESGRFRVAWDLGPIKGANGFDGREAWSEDTSGQSRTEGADTPSRTAFTESYRRAQAWFYPARREAQVTSLGEREDGDRRFLLLSVTPSNGRRFVL
jgi:hypothetical protein